MWIGSPLRGAFRLLSFLTLTLILVPPYFLATALRINPVVRWAPSVTCCHWQPPHVPK